MAGEEKNSRRQMSAGQKLTQFKDYYLAGTLAVLAAAAVIIFMVSRLLLPQKEPVLRIAVFDTDLSDESKEELAGDFRTHLGLPDDAEIVVDSGFVSSNTNEFARLSILASDGLVDLVIADRETFAELSGYGYFKDLSGYLPGEMQEKYAQDFLRFSYVSDAVSDDAAQHGELASGEYPFGLSLRRAGRWQSMTRGSSMAAADPVLGVVLESERDERVLEMIRILME